MKLIRNRRNAYALLLAVSILLAVWIGSRFLLEAAFALGAISAIILMLLVRQSLLLYDATLICDNQILAVPSAIISMSGCQSKKDTTETIVSTFGILIGYKLYRWGLNGVNGTRLYAASIDQERMHLTFGNTASTIKAELLHGMTKKQEVLDTAQKLLYETGITAEIIDW